MSHHWKKKKSEFSQLLKSTQTHMTAGALSHHNSFSGQFDNILL